MTDHDPLCRAQHMSVAADLSDIDGCDCALITKARADERERVARALESEAAHSRGDHGERDLLMLEAARIARGDDE